jgi:hypothetical protein
MALISPWGQKRDMERDATVFIESKERARDEQSRVHSETGSPDCPNLAIPAVTCRRCGQVNQGGLRACTSCHAFLVGHLSAFRNGLRTDRLPPELEHLRMEVAELLASSVADDGGESEVPTRRRGLLEYRARIHRRVLQLDTALELKGLFDRRGKLRTAWLQQLQGLVNTAKGIDSLLGLERRARQLPSSPAEAVRQILSTRQQSTEADHGS